MKHFAGFIGGWELMLIAAVLLICYGAYRVILRAFGKK